MRNDWKDHFLSSVGRASRLPFLAALAVVAAVLWVYETHVSRLAHLVVGWAFWPVWLFCATSVLAKRLHDRGRTGWWSGIILLAVLTLLRRPPVYLQVPCWLVMAWTAFDLGLMPGDPDANSYGPNPLRARAEAQRPVGASSLASGPKMD
jgi:uncharacterized membrane protein YhaH (DUF805 family)